MSDELTYHTTAELRAMTLEEVRALWELVPTDRRKAYRAAYDREIKAAGAEGSDIKEWKIARALLKRYDEAALVPIGTRWARAPLRVQQAAKAPPVEVTEPVNKPSAKGILLLGGLIGVMLLVLFTRGMGGTSTSAPTPDLTATARIATQTPLALDAPDAVIEGGDTARAAFYPVLLHIRLPDDPAPRVWVVQRRSIRASEWSYDPNPDTASWLSGMAVRPVIGIPYSEENAAWFDRISAGAAFEVQMNTGAVLRYQFASREEVRRSDTTLFRQVEPGLALLLLGERDLDGLPTALRPLIAAVYPPEQELTRTGALVGMELAPLPVTPTATAFATPLPFAGLDVQVIAVTTQEGQITTRLRLFNGGTQSMPITPDDITLTLGYVENPTGPRLPAEGLTPFDLLPGQAADVTLVWAWGGEPFASVSVGGWRFSLMLSPE